MLTVPDGVEVVGSASDAAPGALAPLLVLDRVTAFLDEHGLGTGPIAWERIGEGQSNVTYLLRRGGLRMVLRRGPRPPLPRSTHDMVREARIQLLLRPHGVPVPEVLAVCADESVLGVPFYVVEWLAGEVLTSQVPPSLRAPEQRRAVGIALVETLVQLHDVDVRTEPLAALGRPEGFLERQVDRFARLWESGTTRDLPAVQRLAGWLGDNLPTSSDATVVHGDYRTGNVMFRTSTPATTLAVLDWEMATLGDPLTDLGYLTATWSDPDRPRLPVHLSPVTAHPGHLRSEQLAQEYAARTGRDLRALPWYQTLALWRAAVFCEAIRTRWLRGERPGDTSFGPSLEHGVPALLAAAESYAAGSPAGRRS